MTLEKTNRRNFLHTGLAAGAAATAAAAPGPAILAEEAKGANNRVGIGFIGVGGRCGAHMNIVNGLKGQGRVQPVAVCDVYAPRLAAAVKRTGGKPYRNYKELLEDPRVDAVCIASPDRHHAPQAIDAVRAGKDVYVEKPLVHWSQFPLAAQLAEETKKNKRIVQVGTQFMADQAYTKIRKIIADGTVGQIKHVQAGFFRRGDWGERMRVPDANAKPGPDLDWKRFFGAPPRCPSACRDFSSGGSSGTTPAARPPTCSYTRSRRSSPCWGWSFPNACWAAAVPSNTTARCPTSATSSPTIRADPAW